ALPGQEHDAKPRRIGVEVPEERLATAEADGQVHEQARLQRLLRTTDDDGLPAGEQALDQPAWLAIHRGEGRRVDPLRLESGIGFRVGRDAVRPCCRVLRTRTYRQRNTRQVGNDPLSGPEVGCTPSLDQVIEDREETPPVPKGLEYASFVATHAI